MKTRALLAGILGSLTVIVVLSATRLFAAGPADLRLMDAVERGDRQAVRTLIDSRADLNAARSDGSTALVVAVHRNQAEIVDLLLGAGVNVNAANEYGATALAVACEDGKSAMVERLLKAGANPNAALLSGETPLMTAVDKGNLEAVRLLLDHGANVNAQETKAGQTALMWAAAEKNSEIAKALVDHHADLRIRSKGGFTALLFAAQQGDAKTGAILLDAGADINEAAQKDRMTPLMLAAAGRHRELAMLLIERGANLKLAEVRGYTALHFAAPGRNMVEVVKALLQKGADANARTTRDAYRVTDAGFSLKGATPLFLAAAVGNTEAVRALADGGADPLIPTELKTTPLSVAAGTGYPQARDWTDAEKKNLFETAKLLVSLGADVNAVGEHGWTPLHGAAYKAMDDVVQLLAEKGARTEVMDEYGQTPLSIASAVITLGVKDHYYQSARIVRQSTCELLLKLGAQPLASSGIQSVGIFNEDQAK